MCEIPLWAENPSRSALPTIPDVEPADEDADSTQAVAASTSQSRGERSDSQDLEADAQTINSDIEHFRTNTQEDSGRHLSLVAVHGSDATILPSSSFASNANNPDTADDTFASPNEFLNLTNCLEISDASGFKEMEDVENEFSLPLPWVSNSDINLPRLTMDKAAHVMPATLPQVHTAPELLLNLDDDHLSSCHLSETNEAAVSEDNDICIPPPWRCSFMEVRAAVPVISPSASFEMDSLLPQPSNQSQRLSEVASHHSEPYLMHHQLIDLPPRPPADYEIATTLESLDIEDGQMSVIDRVHLWLLSNHPEEQEHVTDDFTQLSKPRNQKSRPENHDISEVSGSGSLFDETSV